MRLQPSATSLLGLPIFNFCGGITTVESLSPRIGFDSRITLHSQHGCFADYFRRRPVCKHARSDVPRNQGVCSDHSMNADPDAGQDCGFRRDHREVFDDGSKQNFARRIGVIGEQDIGKQPDKITNYGFLTYVDTVVRADVMADFTMALNVTFSTELEVSSGMGEFPYGDIMACYQRLAKRGPFVKNAVGADEGIWTDDKWCAVGKSRRVAEFTVSSDNGVVANLDVIMN